MAAAVSPAANIKLIFFNDTWGDFPCAVSYLHNAFMASMLAVGVHICIGKLQQRHLLPRI